MVLSELTKRYRIFYEDLREHMPGLLKDREKYQELRGRHQTCLYVHGEESLAISIEKPRVKTYLLRTIPGARSKSGSVLTFPKSSFKIAAEAIHARLKRQATEADRERGRQLAQRYRFEKQEP